MTALPAHDVLSPMRREAARARRWAVLDGLLATGAALLLLVLVQFGLDRFLRLEIGPRVAALLVVAAVGGREFYRRAVRPALRRVSPDTAAAAAERRDPGLRDALISAVQFAQLPALEPANTSPRLVEELYRLVRERSSGSAAAAVVSTARVIPAAVAFTVAAAVVVLLAASDRPAFRAFVLRNWMLRDVPWPAETRLVPQGFGDSGLAWPRGDPLTLVTRADGKAPQRGVRMVYRTESGARGERAMAAVGPREFRAEFGPLMESMTVWFRLERIGVDEVSAPYAIRALERPEVRTLALRVAPPDYTRRESYALPAGQLDAEVPDGAAVDVEFAANKPLERAWLSDQSDGRVEAERRGETSYAARLVPKSNASYSITLRDEGGLFNTRPTSFALRLLRDRAPRVRLTAAGAGDMLLPQAILPLAIEIEDNLGIQRGELAWQIERSADAAGGPASQPAGAAATPPAASSSPADSLQWRVVVGSEALLGLEPYSTRHAANRKWAISALDLRPTDRLAVTVRAWDFNPKSDPTSDVPANEGRSATLAFRIVAREELLTVLAMRESEWRQVFEQCLKEQEQLRADAIGAHGASPPTDGRDYRALERDQRQVLVRARSVLTQFQSVVSELEINQLMSGPTRRRLDRGVVEPLGRLVGTRLPDAATVMSRLSLRVEAAEAEALDVQMAEIVAEMRSILTQMLKWEGYNEAVGLLRDVLKLQGDLNRETRRELERALDELFGEPTTRPNEVPADE